MKKILFAMLSLLMFTTLQAGTFNTSAPTHFTSVAAQEQKETKSLEIATEKTKAPATVKSSSDKEPKTRKRWVAIVLCFFFGVLGLHRFYMGDMVIGLIQLFTGGGGGLWWLIDLFRLFFGGFSSRF